LPADYEIDLHIYGSFATDLNIENSDIDISVHYKRKTNSTNTESEYDGVRFQTVESIINELVNSFSNLKIFELINPIYTASVPVIKLVI
jgi:DNA polymerase sigma